MSDLFILDFKTGHSDTLIETISGQKNNVLIKANSIQPTKFLSIVSSKKTPLFIVILKNAVVYLYDKNLTTILSLKNKFEVEELLYVLEPNVEYYIKIEAMEGVSQNDKLCYLSTYSEITVYNYFPYGIENKASLSNKLYRTENTLGEVIYNFNEYPLTQNEVIHLCSAGQSIKNGVLNIISSDTNVFKNQSINFDPPNGFQIFLTVNQTTVFTGSIKITIDGVKLTLAETGYVLN